MLYEGNIIRPPSESNSIILQVTAGCSYNKCTFCGAYKEKPFRIRTDSLLADIDFASRYCLRQKRVFLADGDVLILPQQKLVEIFQHIRAGLPWVNRISLYANARAIRSKSHNELVELKKLGLDRLYMGLESGLDSVLDDVCKGETAQSMVAAAETVRNCNLFLSVTILLGIAGVALSQRHARVTGNILSQMAPNQIAALTLMILPGTRLYEQKTNGDFILPDSFAVLRELRTVIEHITLDHVQFHANHASNYLLLSGRLSKDKSRFLARIDDALRGSVPLIDENWRAL